MLPSARRILTDGSYRGRCAILVAGGPSVTEIMPKAAWMGLQKAAPNQWTLSRVFIGCNMSFTLQPEINYIGDLVLIQMLEQGHRWRKYCQRKLQLISDGLRPNLKRGQIKCEYCYELPRKTKHNQWGESLEEGVGMGNNAGYVILNLAWILGARPIYLIGYDFYGDGHGRAAHWHDEYKGTDRETSDEYDCMLKCFRDNVPEHVRGEVVNLNPESRLDIFEKRRVEDVL